IRWSGKAVQGALASGLRWLACLLAGPVVFAAVGWVYWFSCGDPGWLDWLILAEVGLVGAAYWIYALLALADRGRLRDLNPVAVADLAYRLGWRGFVAVLLGAALLLAHGWAVLVGLAEAQAASPAGWLLLAGAWASGVFWGTFFCRLLGVHCH